MVIIPNASYPLPTDSYIALLYFSGKGVYNPGIGEKQISRGFPLGYRN
jgi:hypothetical protein